MKLSDCLKVPRGMLHDTLKEIRRSGLTVKRQLARHGHKFVCHRCGRSLFGVSHFWKTSTHKYYCAVCHDLLYQDL